MTKNFQNELVALRLVTLRYPKKLENMQKNRFKIFVTTKKSSNDKKTIKMKFLDKYPKI